MLSAYLLINQDNALLRECPLSTHVYIKLTTGQLTQLCRLYL